jgi:polyphosphate kinase
VSIDLIVRGFCCLRPGVPGVTENIRIISVIGRFLEHSRIFHFANGVEDPIEGEYYLGSADWMHRNLTARVEAITPVEPRALRERLWEILDVSLKDQRQAWDMQGDGSYVQRRPQEGATGAALEGTQAAQMASTRRRILGARG